MKKEDKMTLFIFFTLIFLIIGIFIYNAYSNRKTNNVDRKIEYIFNSLTYNDVYIKGSELLNQATLLMTNNDNFNYEKNNNGKVNIYTIGEYKNLKKITNFWLVENTFSLAETERFIDYKKIVKNENNYFIENSTSNDTNYIGSIIDIDRYDSNTVYFTSTNYYCDNYKYLGVINEDPDCNYKKEKSTFSIILENNNLRINNIEEIKNIIK